MDKDKWLADKIATLIDEGKPRDQAVAQANAMWDAAHDKAMMDEPPVDEEDSERLEAAENADEDEPEHEEKALFARIWQRVQEKLGSKEAPDDGTGFKVKGNHWIAWWSNNFIDREGEIFTEKAIDAYVARVDAGIVPPPALAIWHLGEKAYIGKAEWVARHGHSLMAAGEFYPTTSERIKSYYRKHVKSTSLSHGFTFPKSQFDGTHYHAFNTFEISLLPRGVEANSYTSLEGVKEMPVTKVKEDYLKEVGYTDEEIKQILASRTERDKAIEERGEAFKDFTDVNHEDAGEADLLDAATKAFKDLFPELIAADADNAQANLKTAKIVAADHATLTEMAADVKKIKAFMAQTPKRASAAKETELDEEDEDDKEIIDQIEMEQRDEKAAKAFPGLFDPKADIRKLVPNSAIRS